MEIDHCSHIVFSHLIFSSTTVHLEQHALGIPIHIETLLRIVVSYMEVILEFISVLCVAIGLFKTLQLSLILVKNHRRRPSFPLVDVRLQFGVWLAVALEFQLGADILATTVAPSFDTLGKLGAIALIRTFLNYFLNKELVEEYRLIAEPTESAAPPSPPFQ